MEFHQAILLLVIGTTVALSAASIPWHLCRESVTRSPAITRFSLPGALCAYLAAVVGIAVVARPLWEGDARSARVREPRLTRAHTVTCIPPCATRPVGSGISR